MTAGEGWAFVRLTPLGLYAHSLDGCICIKLRAIYIAGPPDASGFELVIEMMISFEFVLVFVGPAITDSADYILGVYKTASPLAAWSANFALSPPPMESEVRVPHTPTLFN